METLTQKPLLYCKKITMIIILCIAIECTVTTVIEVRVCVCVCIPPLELDICWGPPAEQTVWLWFPPLWRTTRKLNVHIWQRAWEDWQLNNAKPSRLNKLSCNVILISYSSSFEGSTLTEEVQGGYSSPLHTVTAHGEEQSLELPAWHIRAESSCSHMKNTELNPYRSILMIHLWWFQFLCISILCPHYVP